MCSVELNANRSTLNANYYHTDHLGSSSVITDESGNRVQQIEYSPYGSIVTNKTMDNGPLTVDYYFTGKELDSTGLYFYGARYYDPQIGRFISADPTVQHPYDPQDLNRYAYCRNNPINYVDPSGLGWFKNLFKSFAKAFAGGFAGGLATAILFPFIGPLAFAVGGAIAGATTSALNGAGWQGILIGAGMGAVLGGGLGGLACAGHGLATAVIGGAIAVGGGIQAYQQGGWEGVANYGAGVAGGITGFATGSSVGSGVVSSIRRGVSNDLRTPAKNVEDVASEQLNINKSIQDLKKIQWSKEAPKGKYIVKALEGANNSGKIQVDFPAYSRAAGEYNGQTGIIKIHPGLGDWDCPGVLMHEGTHLFRHQDGLPYSGLAAEREAFNYHYMTNEALGLPAYNPPSDEWIRKEYGF